MTDETKLPLTSSDVTAEVLAQLREIAPHVFTEGGVDPDKLKALLGENIVPKDERYGLNWAGKSEAFRNVQIPSVGTLLPQPEESVNFDTSENLIIEGDNLEVLKLLQKSYHGKVKMIYIDPPYNTGNEFIYPDNYHEGLDDYLKYSGQVNDEGQRNSSEKDATGRFHSKWLNMMYPRLFLARNLLRSDGVIFVNIGDDEIHNLRALMNEVFGEENFVATCIWEKKNKGAFLAKDITNMKDYVVVFCKDKGQFNGLIGQIAEEEETYPCVNAPNAREIRTIPAGIKSKFREKNHVLKKGSVISADTMSLVLHSDLVIKDGVLAEELVIEGNWRYKQDAMTEYANKEELYLTQDLYLRRIVKEPRLKTLRDILPRLGTSGQPASSTIESNNLFTDGWGTNEDANEELRQLLGEQNLFDYPKPSQLIAKLICSVRDENALVLDFFAGSGTTGHAVDFLNGIDGGNRKYILVQLPEKTEQPALPTIAHITRERMRKVIQRLEGDASYKRNNKLGFKAFKLTSSNFKIWNADTTSTEAEALGEQLRLYADNVEKERNQQDILYELVLKSGLPLSAKVEQIEVAGKPVYSIAQGQLLICLEHQISQAVLRGMITLTPIQMVCLDRAFGGNDQLKTNTVLDAKSQDVTFRTV
jgi:adenine-specific DNA-methyltransferase